MTEHLRSEEPQHQAEMSYGVEQYIHYFDIISMPTKGQTILYDNGPFINDQESRDRVRKVFLDICNGNQDHMDQVNTKIDWTIENGFWERLAGLRIYVRGNDNEERAILYPEIIREYNPQVARALWAAKEDTEIDLYVLKRVFLEGGRKYREEHTVTGIIPAEDRVSLLKHTVNSGGARAWCMRRQMTYLNREYAEAEADRLAFDMATRYDAEVQEFINGVITYSLLYREDDINLLCVDRCYTVTKVQVKGLERNECYDLNV